MACQQETPFESIEGALEYIGYLLEASREAQAHVATKLERTDSPNLARRKQALQIVNHKLVSLDFHISRSEHLLKDLRKLRRLILEEREIHTTSAKA